MDNAYLNTTLVERVAAGDESAFTQLFHHHFHHLYGFAHSVVKSHELAEEIVQDVFVRVWKNRQQLLTVERLDDWLFIITRNVSFKALQDLIRDTGRSKQLEKYFDLAPDTAEQQVLYKESLSIIEEAVQTLPPQQQQVFRLSRMQNLSLDEIAAVMSLSKNTIKSHLTKALHSVRLFIQLHACEWLLLVCLTHL
jgi:RNA polymerase sigma-70 factor (family 1)